MCRSEFITGLTAALLIGVIGCNRGIELGQVSGQVTMDSDPLPNALVRFLPEGGGRSAQGITDASGHYELDYSVRDTGALVGMSKVLITTGSLEDTSGRSEKVPKKYNAESTLAIEVRPGSNAIDFELESQ